MKQIAITVIAAFALTFASQASASVMHSKKHQQQSTVESFVSPLGPTASVISSTVFTRQQVREARREARLTGMQVAFTPTVSTSQAVTALSTPVTRHNRYRSVNTTVVSRPAVITAAAADPTPEPGSVSFLLMGLFGTALYFVRRRQANNNSPTV